MKLTEEIKRMRQIMSVINEEKTNISISCPKCNHGWTIDDNDEDPYLCHNCGYNKLEGKYELDKLAKWKKENDVNENEDEDRIVNDYSGYDYDDPAFDIRTDLIDLKKELMNAGVNDNTRLHLTHDSELRKVNIPQELNGPKPKGLWYCVGFGWLDFTTNDFKSFYNVKDTVHAFEVSLDGLNILKITNYKELIVFEKMYSAPARHRYSEGQDINWAKIAEKYDGIEIAPYLYKARYEHRWYYPWDVASGCIWNTVSLKTKKLLQ
jgi:hypothetical protein